jgi:hypothetical protein
MIILIEGPVYLDQTRPNVNRIFANLIYFDFIGFRKYLDEPIDEYTLDETTDEIMSVTGD